MAAATKKRPPLLRQPLFIHRYSLIFFGIELIAKRKTAVIRDKSSARKNRTDKGPEREPARFRLHPVSK